jgi:hypothetical protein
MANMVDSPMPDRVERDRNSSNLTLIVWTAVAAIAVIVALYALMASPGITPDEVLSIFAPP